MRGKLWNLVFVGLLSLAPGAMASVESELDVCIGVGGIELDIGDCEDPDGDGIDAEVDLCLNVFDPEQGDADGDGVGDACDDEDGDLDIGVCVGDDCEDTGGGDIEVCVGRDCQFDGEGGITAHVCIGSAEDCADATGGSGGGSGPGDDGNGNGDGDSDSDGDGDDHGAVPGGGYTPAPAPTDDGGSFGGEDEFAVGGGCSATRGGTAVWLAILLALILPMLMRRRSTIVHASVAVAVSLAGPATAQTVATSIPLEAGSHGGYMVEGSAVARPMEVGLSATLDYAADPLYVVSESGMRTQDVVNDATTLYLGAWVGLPKGFEVRALLPMHRVDTGMEFDSGYGVGDVNLGAKWRVLDRRSHAIGLSANVDAWLPTGDAESFRGSRGVVGRAAISADRGLGPVVVAASAGVRLSDDEQTFAGSSYQQQALLGARADWAAHRHLVVGAEYVLGLPLDGEDSATPSEALARVTVPVGGFAVGVGGALGLSDSIGVPQYRVLGTVAYRFGSQPDTRPARAALAEAGPTRRAPRPEAPVEAARAPEPMLVIEQPEPAPAADEGDTGEPALSERMESGARIALHDILFETSSHRLRPESFPVLDELAAALITHGALNARIEGHTDSRGGERFNLVLSQQRALAVMKYLVKAGVAADRLEHAGFGEAMPLETNDTAAGRARNRRVEIALR